MVHNFEFAPWMVRLRAPLFAAMILAFSGCDTTESVSPDGLTLDEPGVETAAVSEPSFASVSFAGGIPMGTSSQPLSAFGSPFNGAKLTIAPGELMKYLAAIKARGGKVVVGLAGSPRHYNDARGFNLTKWKARIDRFKGINFSSYINDGTVIGHWLVDEPNDATNWHGRVISPAVVDEMARYSKSRWSKMATIVRTEPGYFKNYRPRYLDAAWAAYVTRKGSAPDYIRRNVADAQRAGLGLVVGLNISKGGPNQRRLTPSEVKSFGLAMLSSTYPCAFISWQYDNYVGGASMRDAMRILRAKAQSRSTRTCRG